MDLRKHKLMDRVHLGNYHILFLLKEEMQLENPENEPKVIT